MSIEVTDEMIYAFAGEPEITGTDAHAISVGLRAVLGIVERDYVSRWGVVRLEVPREVTLSGTYLDGVKKWAADQAKCMGGTIVDIDGYEIYTDDPQLSMRDCVVLTWKMRRD